MSLPRHHFDFVVSSKMFAGSLYVEKCEVRSAIECLLLFEIKT
jgi:hypothetical protein